MSLFYIEEQAKEPVKRVKKPKTVKKIVAEIDQDEVRQIMSDFNNKDKVKDINTNVVTFTSQHPKNSPEYILELLETNPRLFFFDTETTGMTSGASKDHDPSKDHKIIEIGVIGTNEEHPDHSQTFHYLVDPERSIDIEATKVHGFTNEHVKGKPKFREIVEEFISFVSGSVLVAHNADFDVKFINQELRQAGYDQTIEDIALVLDSLQLSRFRHGVASKHNLDALQKRYDIQLDRLLHGALLDSEILCHVFFRMLVTQQSIFSNQNNDLHAVYDFHKITKSFNIPKPSLTEDELAAHNEYIAKMEKKSGESIWTKLQQE